MSEVLAIPAEPLISVVMPVRNGAAYVADAVSSIQAQSYPHWELMVIDNESDEIVERVAGGMPFATLTDLEYAGSLLVRIARDQETLLRQQMLRRWRGACRTSAQLGTAAWRCYERDAPQFGIPATGDDRRLRAARALRVSSDSRLVRRVNGLVNASRRSRHAAS